MIAIERAVYLSFAFDCGIPPVEHYSLQDLLPIHSIYIYIYIFIYYYVKHRTLVPASSFNGLEEYELTSVYLTELEKTSQKKKKKKWRRTSPHSVCAPPSLFLFSSYQGHHFATRRV